MAMLVALGLAVPVLNAQQPTKESPFSNAQAAEETLNNDTVIELVRLGLGESLVIDKIKASPCEFDVRVVLRPRHWQIREAWPGRNTEVLARKGTGVQQPSDETVQRCLSGCPRSRGSR